MPEGGEASRWTGGGGEKGENDEKAEGKGKSGEGKGFARDPHSPATLVCPSSKHEQRERKGLRGQHVWGCNRSFPFLFRSFYSIIFHFT